MKILLIDNKLTGHHLPYAKVLGETDKYEVIYFIPKECNELGIKNKQIIMKYKPNSIKYYLLWINEILDIAKKENIDIIHFLYGDILYKFLGIGLGKLKKFKIIVTFHQIRRSILRDFSRKLIFKNIECGIVHTNTLKILLNSLNIKNVMQIEYPKLSELPTINKYKAREFFGINNKDILIGAIGGTRNDKGLDLLLDALNLVNKNFHILIAGKAEDFDEKFIKDKISSYKEKVTLYMKFLDQEELNMALNAVDVIALPYKKSFDGASGPLAEGVWLRKTIIGPNHGSLGEIIRSNELGYIFESENVNSLVKVIEKSIYDNYKWNDKAEKYREKLSINNFKEEYYRIYSNL